MKTFDNTVKFFKRTPYLDHIVHFIWSALLFLNPQDRKQIITILAGIAYDHPSEDGYWNPLDEEEKETAALVRVREHGAMTKIVIFRR